ncbi:MAG: HAMP domain-containing sensor histidine kinase [Candidatus Margulisbacteria bacterium]|nr:HAMP domain-containing sensor histidine kinase [Candidatus Margulisiibacteriota bacterium]
MNDVLDKEEIFNQIIHDLKSPLAAILGLSEVFLRVLAGDLNEKQKEVIKKIGNHGRFALELIEDILDIENISSGKLQIEKTSVALKPFIEDIIQGHIIMAAEKNLQLNVQIPENIMVEVDERRMKQVLNNLINNALKFSHRGSNIDISAREDEHSIYIEVRDFGIGIKKEEIQLLFKPFSQLSNKPTANEKSTGLGLSIVRKLVELHNGEIFVDSEENKGSTFTIKLNKVSLPLQ